MLRLANLSLIVLFPIAWFAPLMRAGLGLPLFSLDEISVISGNNDHAFITGLYPQLTTFDIHAHDIGRLAVRQLETRLSMNNAIANVDLTLEPHLTPGESVRQINN